MQPFVEKGEKKKGKEKERKKSFVERCHARLQTAAIKSF